MRTLALFTAAAAGFATAGATVPASAVGTCSTDNTFCVTHTLTVSDAGTSTAASAAAAPIDLGLAFSNTSPAHTDTKTLWLKQVSLQLLSGLGGHAYTPSANLPDGLIIAGGDQACGTPPDFTACAAGSGTFLADVTGSGLFDGVHSGTFGIQRITNVSPPPTGDTAEWLVTAQFCLGTSFGACTPSPQTSQFDVTIGAAGAGTNGDTIVMPMMTSFSPTTGVTVDASLDSLTLHLDGASNRVSGQAAPLDAPLTVLHLPTHCGTAAADATFTDRADAAVTFPVTQSVTGCPTARFTDAERLLRATFAGGSSTVGVAGRSIAKWHWTFGDGTSKVTTGPTVAHTYAASRDRTVRLVVEDSLGALSTARPVLLRGSAMTWAASASQVKPGTAVTLSGRLTRWHTTTGLAGRGVRVERCRVGTSRCTLVKTVTTSRKAGHLGQFRLVVHPTAAGDYRATFFGGNGYLGIRKVRRITLR